MLSPVALPQIANGIYVVHLIEYQEEVLHCNSKVTEIRIIVLPTVKYIWGEEK